MSKTFHFLIDECISDLLLDCIQGHGYSCTSILRLQQSGISDAEVIRLCKKINAVLITHDIALAAALRTDVTFPGIILFRTKSTSTKYILKRIQVLLSSYTFDQIQNALVICSDQKIRIRKLPS